MSWMLVLWFPLAVWAVEFDQYSVNCGRLALANLEKQITPIGKIVEKVIGRKLSSIHTETERTFLLNNPGAAEYIRRVACRSIALSIVGCGVDEKWFLQKMGDEESDAIRHYVFSALLACGRGKAFAERFAIAHEGNGPWDDGNRMDIHNNYVGFKWADPDTGNCESENLEQRLVEAALSNLAEHRLVTLKKGETTCRDPDRALADAKALPKDDFRDRLNTTSLSLKNVLPKQCP